MIINKIQKIVLFIYALTIGFFGFIVVPWRTTKEFLGYYTLWNPPKVYSYTSGRPFIDLTAYLIELFIPTIVMLTLFLVFSENLFSGNKNNVKK